MYNKIFTKILDSSIWMQPSSTRLVWLTLIAAMDETGFAQFAGVANLAHRARVSVEECKEAVECLQSKDEDSSDPEHDGRRIERVPGGWMILNAPKYREIVTREVSKEQTRIRVQRYREKKRTCNGHVTPSEADTDTEADTKTLPVSTESLNNGSHSKEQIRSIGSTAGIPEDVCDAYFDSMEACGWIDKHSRPVKSVPHHLSTFWRHWQSNNAEKAAKNGNHPQRTSKFAW